MIQRVGLAQALIDDPEVIFLDEPMSGLDPLGRRDVRALILRLRDEGRTVFFSSHILSDAETLCSRIAIVAKGRLMASGTLADLVTAQLKGWEIILDGVRRRRRHRTRASAPSPPSLPGGMRSKRCPPRIRCASRASSAAWAGAWCRSPSCTTRSRICSSVRSIRRPARTGSRRRSPRREAADERPCLRPDRAAHRGQRLQGVGARQGACTPSCCSPSSSSPRRCCSAS